MKVLLTSHRFWPSVGGTEEVVASLARHLALLGHDVTVATSDEPGAPAEEAREGYRIRRFKLRRVSKFRFPGEDYVRFVRDGDWDVAHLHGQRVWSTDHLYRHLKRFRAPAVFTAHGFYQWHVERTPLVDAWYYRRVLPRALRHATATALTDAERDELAGWGVEGARVIPDGFEPSEFATLPRGFRKEHAFAEDEPLLLYVGGLYPNKRVDRLVRAAGEAGATLAVIGRDAVGGQRKLSDLAQHVGARVRFMGPRPRHDVLGAYAEADLFLLASEFEGFGLVLLESMAAGLPFLATPAGASRDLAKHDGGRVVPADELGREAKRLLGDKPRLRAMGENGRAAAPMYAWSRIASQYEALYEEVARR